MSVKKPREAREPSLLVNLSACRYTLVRDAAERNGYRVAEDETEPWDLFWSDLSVSVDRVQRLLPFQRLNHFPGMLEICRKAALSRHMARMAARLPGEFDFYPPSLLLPDQLDELLAVLRRNKARAEAAGGGGGGGGCGGDAGGGGGGGRDGGRGGVVTYILKPSAGTQGRGISLVQYPAQLAEAGDVSGCVAQAYVSSPLLLDGYKFDLRVYALVASVDPLRIHLYDEGLARLATQPYKPPSPANLRAATMHLTNYAVNKGAAGFVSSDAAAAAGGAAGGGGASKRPMSAVLEQLAAAHGTSREALMASIADVVTKTVMAIQPLLAHTYHTSLSPAAAVSLPPPCGTPSLDHVGSGAPDPTRPCACGPSVCFELLGFDILFDTQLQPWLLEVNHSPSFCSDSGLDREVKGSLLARTIRMLGQRAEERMAFQEAEARAQNERLYSAGAAGSSPAAIAAALATGGGAGGRRAMSALPRSRHLQATAAALEELTANSAALLAAGGYVWGSSNGGSGGASSCYGGASGGAYGGCGGHGCDRNSRAGSAARAMSSSPASGGSDCVQAERRAQALGGGGGLDEDSCGEGHGNGHSGGGGGGGFRLVFPVAGEAERKRYMRVLQTAADLFPQQRCQCAWCTRRREVSLLTSTGQQLGAAARPLSALPGAGPHAQHHYAGLSGHLPMRAYGSFGAQRRSGSASAGARWRQGPRRSSATGMEGSGRSGRGGAGEGDAHEPGRAAADTAAAAAPAAPGAGRLEGGPLGRPPRPHSRASNSRPHAGAASSAHAASGAMPVLLPRRRSGAAFSSSVGGGGAGGGGGAPALRSQSSESSLASVPGEAGGGDHDHHRRRHASETAPHPERPRPSLLAANGGGSAPEQPGSGAGPHGRGMSGPPSAPSAPLSDAGTAHPHSLSNQMLSSLRPLLHSLSQPQARLGGAALDPPRPPTAVAAQRPPSSTGAGHPGSRSAAADSRGPAAWPSRGPSSRGPSRCQGHRGGSISPVGSEDPDAEGLRRSHSFSELEAEMRRASGAAAAADGRSAPLPPHQRLAASSSLLDSGQTWLATAAQRSQQRGKAWASGGQASQRTSGVGTHGSAGPGGADTNECGAGTAGADGVAAGGGATGSAHGSRRGAAAAAAAAGRGGPGSADGRLGDGSRGSGGRGGGSGAAGGVPRVARLGSKRLGGSGAAAMSPADLELLMVRIRTASALTNRFVSVYAQER